MLLPLNMTLLLLQPRPLTLCQVTTDPVRQANLLAAEIYLNKLQRHAYGVLLSPSQLISPFTFAFPPKE